MRHECCAPPSFAYHSCLMPHCSCLIASCLIAHTSASTAHASFLIAHTCNLREKMNDRPRAFLPVIERETLVFRMRVAGRVFDAEEDQRDGFEGVGEGAHEGDRAAGALHHRFAAVAAREGAASFWQRMATASGTTPAPRPLCSGRSRQRTSTST